MKAPWKHVDCRLAITDAPLGFEHARCPNHADDTSSLMVSADGCYCFGCQFRLPRMAPLAYLLFGAWSRVELDKAFALAEKYTSEAVDSYRQRVEEAAKREPLPLGLARAYCDLLHTVRSDRAQWLYDRGLTPRILDDAQIGHDGTRFTIPVFDAGGRLLTIRYRRDDLYGTSSFDP